AGADKKQTVAIDEDEGIMPMLSESSNGVPIAQYNIESDYDESQAAPPDAAPVSSMRKEKATTEDSYEKGMDLYRKQDYSNALVYLKEVEENTAHPKYWDAVYYSAMAN